MQHRAVFGGVDALAGEHAAGPASQVALGGELAEQLQGAAADPVLGEIEQEFVMAEVELLETARLGLKELAHMGAIHFLAVFAQEFPGGAVSGGV